MARKVYEAGLPWIINEQLLGSAVAIKECTRVCNLNIENLICFVFRKFAELDGRVDFSVHCAHGRHQSPHRHHELFDLTIIFDPRKFECLYFAN